MLLLPMEETLRVWTEVNQESIFSDYMVQSQHPNNEIMLQLHTDHFISTLKSATQSQDVKFSLQKKQNIRSLTAVIHILTPSGVTRPISQEIPIELKLAEDITLAEPPALPKPEVNVYLPPIKTLKTIIDKMKSMSDKLCISANMAGDLVLKIETTMVVARTFFHDLVAPKWRDSKDDGASGRTQTGGTDTFLDATIDIHHLVKFLSGNSINPQNVLMSISRDRAVILFMIHESMSLTYFIPVISD